MSELNQNKGVGAKKRVGELLVSQGVIETEDLEQALAIQRSGGGKLAEILIREGHLDVENFAAFLVSQPGVGSIDLSHYDVPAEIISLIPCDFCREHEVFPIDKIGRLLTVGMVCPLDTKTKLELEESTGLQVKALLCSPTDIRKAIDRNFSNGRPNLPAGSDPVSPDDMESFVRLESVATMVDHIDSLPALPQTVEKVREALENPDIDLRDVSDIIALDPGLAAKLLQLANSASYGLSRLIASVHGAVTLLGLNETYAVVLASAVVKMIEDTNRFDFERFSDEANFTALAAQNLAQACWKKKRYGVFTAGLLHDIGRFALSEVVPERYKKIDASLDGPSLLAEEHRVLGIGHPEAGFILAQSWNLPDEIAMAIRFHHTPEHASREKEFVALVALATHLNEVCRAGEDSGLNPVEGVEGLLELLKLDAAQVQEVYQKTLKEFA
jgi:HD-like signal output (HDOD) protein